MYLSPLEFIVRRGQELQISEIRQGQTGIPNPGPLNLREREDESVYVEAVKA
jgi:hypothetical protein